MSSGAVLHPSTGMDYGISTSGPGASIVSVPINSTYDSGNVGGEGCVRVDHSYATILDCQFYGIGFRHGVTFVDQATPLRNVTIDGCTMHDVGFGVLKNNTPTENLVIANCKIYDVAAGDGIELNIGGDTNCLITGNTISAIRSGGYLNTGIGIGIAGNGTYGQSLSVMARAVTISNNTVTDVDLEGIHLEVMYGCAITGNSVVVDSTKRAAIAIYGSAANTIEGNDITGGDIGIWDSMGDDGTNYVVSSTRNSVTGNKISGCRIGIMSRVAGQGTSFLADNNEIHGGTLGIQHIGPCSVTMQHNRVHDATTPYRVDLTDTGIPDTAKGLTFEGNAAWSGGSPVASPLTYIP